MMPSVRFYREPVEEKVKRLCVEHLKRSIFNKVMYLYFSGMYSKQLGLRSCVCIGR